jgi:hypothetical protein
MKMMPVRKFTAGLVVVAAMLAINFGAAQVVKVQVFNEARRPVANATVFFAPVGDQGIVLTSPQRIRTDKDGIATVLVDPFWNSSGWETKSIAFWARKGNFESVTEYFPQTRFRIFNETPLLTLYLRPTEPFPVQIRVTEKNGSPVADGWVALLARIRKTGEMANWLASWRTDKNGEVKGSFRLRRALLEWFGDEIRLFLVAWHSQKGWAWRFCTPVELRRIEIELKPPQPVKMSFRNCFGEPVSSIKGRLAQIFLPDLPHPIPLPPNPFTFASNKSGILEVPLPAGVKGSWEWHIETPADIRRSYKSQGNFLSLSPGTSWDIRFHDRTTHVAGTLIDAETGKPLANCPLLIEFHTGVIFSAAGTYWHRTLTNQRGRYRAVIDAPISSPNWRGGLIALHLPDGQRVLRKPKEQEKSLTGCWRLSFPNLSVKPLTGELIVKADFEVKEYPVPKELGEAAKRAHLEFLERLKHAQVFIAAKALPQDKTEQSILVEAVNCEGQRLNLEFVCRQDGVGAVALAPPSQPINLRLKDGDWLVVAYIALPHLRYLHPTPVSAHFFAHLEMASLPFESRIEKPQKVHLPPNQTVSISLSAVSYGNLFVYRPEALHPKLSKKR